MSVTAARPSTATAPTTQPPRSRLPGVIWDCTAPAPLGLQSRVEPPGITFACADNGDGFDHAVWASWTSSGATATGVIWMKKCTPNCATGGIGFYPASIRLSDVVRVKNGLLFTRLTAKYSGSGPVYQGGPDKGKTITHFALPTAP
jgi:eukaryotic-like serine/threonine-protein kinase